MMSLSISLTFSTVQISVSYTGDPGLVFHQKSSIYLVYHSNVDPLTLEEFQDIGHGLERQKLFCANILLALLNSQNSSETISEAINLPQCYS